MSTYDVAVIGGGIYAGGDLTQRCQDVLSAAAAGAAIARKMTRVLLKR